MSHSSFTELETFIAKFRATAAENLGWHKPDGEHILSAIDSWIDKNRAATKIAPHSTLDAKNFVLLTKLLPVMNEPLKLTLLHIAGMPERLNDPSLHDHLLTWIMKRSVPEARKLFFEVLHEIDNQTVASAPIVAASAAKSESKPMICQIAVGDNLLSMNRCTASCKTVINGVSVCESHRKELCQMSESLMSIKITPTSKPLRLYAGETVAYQIQFEKDTAKYFCQANGCDGCLAYYETTYGVYLCSHHATIQNRKKLIISPDTRLVPFVEKTTDDNMSKVIPVRTYTGDSKFFFLEPNERWYCCQVQLDERSCSRIAEYHDAGLGALMCKTHVAELKQDPKKQLSVPVDAPRVKFEEVAVVPKRCEMAVGDNMLRPTQCDKLCFQGKKGKGDDFEICADHATEIFNKNQCVDGRWPITTLTPVKCFEGNLKITPLRECEKDTWRCQVVVAGGVTCSDVATHNTIYGNLMCSVHAAYVTGGSFRNMSIPAGASKIVWKSPKTQSRDEELLEAVGPNLVVSKSRLYCAAIDSKTGQPCSRKMVFYSNANGTSVGFCSVHLPANYSTSN